MAVFAVPSQLSGFTGLIIVLSVYGAVFALNDRVKRQVPPNVPPQIPPVFEALDQLRGSEPLSATQIQQIIAYAYPGSSYPTYSYIPATSFSCSQVKQFGFYADPETRCQVFRRCEANNYMFSYICPNGTVFNQITLVCDWFFNVQCPSVGGFYDYSNPRIYRQDLKLFDDVYGAGAAGYGAGAAAYGAGAGAGYSSNSLAGGSYGMVGGYSSPAGQMYASGNNPVPAAASALAGSAAATGAQYRMVPQVRSAAEPAAAANPSPLTGQQTQGAALDAAYR